MASIVMTYEVLRPNIRASGPAVVAALADFHFETLNSLFLDLQLRSVVNDA
jgi:hypothetical protein